jgi:hypothetical protein
MSNNNLMKVMYKLITLQHPLLNGWRHVVMSLL